MLFLHVINKQTPPSTKKFGYLKYQVLNQLKTEEVFKNETNYTLMHSHDGEPLLAKHVLIDIHIQRIIYLQLPTRAPCLLTALFSLSPAACRGLGKRLPFPLDKAHCSARRDRQQVSPGSQNYKNSTRITEHNNTIALTYLMII